MRKGWAKAGGRTAIRAFALLLLLALPAALGAAVLRVPAEFPTIKSAVGRAAAGDTVLVDDGVYLEKNIEIAAAVTVRSRNLFGAVIYGSRRAEDAVFIVRAAARIEGFVVKGAGVGILQRGSPDVEWRASNLVIEDCAIGLSIDDAGENVGSAVVRHVAVLGRSHSAGMMTNDARGLDAADCLVVGCRCAFEGYDHLSFRVRRSAVVDCQGALIGINNHRPVWPASSRIEAGEGLEAVGGAGAIGEAGGGAEEFGAVVDGAVAVAVEGEEAVQRAVEPDPLDRDHDLHGPLAHDDEVDRRNVREPLDLRGIRRCGAALRRIAAGAPLVVAARIAVRVLDVFAGAQVYQPDAHALLEQPHDLVVGDARPGGGKAGRLQHVLLQVEELVRALPLLEEHGGGRHRERAHDAHRGGEEHRVAGGINLHCAAPSAGRFRGPRTSRSAARTRS